MSLSRERCNEPWHAAFVNAIETFRIPHNRLLLVRDVLEAFAVILEAWEDHHVGEQYWAGLGTFHFGLHHTSDGPDPKSLFADLYDVLRDSDATPQEIFRVCANIVRYLKTLVFTQTFGMYLTCPGLCADNIEDWGNQYNHNNPERVPTLLNWNSHYWAASLCDSDYLHHPLPAPALLTPLAEQPAGPTNMGRHSSLDVMQPLTPLRMGIVHVHPSRQPLRPFRPLANDNWPSEPRDPAQRRAPPPPWDDSVDAIVRLYLAPTAAFHRYLVPCNAFELAPLELARTNAWHRLTTVVHALQSMGLPSDNPMTTRDLQHTVETLDRTHDLCLFQSGLAARLQWYLAMVLVGAEEDEDTTLSRVHHDLNHHVEHAADYAFHVVRVRVTDFLPGQLSHDEPNIAALRAYSRQLLDTINSMRLMNIWQDRPGALAARFRARLDELEVDLDE